jgi:hypothetical protein
MKGLQTKYNILTAAKVGIEFEFYTEKTPSAAAKELGRALNKKIVVPKSTVAFNKEEKGTYHSELEPTSTVFKLEKDFSGGKDMKELITGPLPYEEARIVIIKTLDWIKSNGWTDKKCAIHLNVSFNPFLIKLKNEISHLNPLKLILSYDENYIYERFPERKDSVYAQSINQVIPINKFTFQSTPENVDSSNFIVPDEKYYGINFTKRTKNYLEIRYLGGKDYEFKTAKILEILDYSILKIYESLQTPQFTTSEIEKLKTIVVNMRKVGESFSSPERFFVDFPKINVFIDMKGNKEILKSYWTSIREQLFNLIVSGGLKEGIFNFDTDISVSQLRYAKLNNAHGIENFEMFDCEFNGAGENIAFFRCKIKNSRLKRCKLVEFNEIEDSKVEHTSSFPTNTFLNCYINSPDDIVEGKIEGGVIRNAIIGQRAEISSTALMVDHTPEAESKKIQLRNDKK